MNELQRRAYLDALGVDSYVSRGQLPGAAVTRRLVIVRRDAPTVTGTLPFGSGERGPAPGALPVLETPARAHPQVPAAVEQPHVQPVEVPRITLAVIVAGNWLWLEDLAGAALAREQVWLIRSMAYALRVHGGGREALADPHVSQFAWPIHNNQQLDLGPDAARAALAGFVGRKLREHSCCGLVLLGDVAGQWLDVDAVEVGVARTASTVHMLQHPGDKRGVWRDLVAFAEHA